MYNHLEEALDGIEYLKNHSLFPERLLTVLSNIESDIKGYITEDTGSNEEDSPFGN